MKKLFQQVINVLKDWIVNICYIKYLFNTQLLLLIINHYSIYPIEILNSFLYFYFYADPALRPVLIIGPLSECVVTKLLQEFPGEFTRCLAEAMHCSQATLEQGLRDSLYVDYRKKGSYFECTTVQAVKDICEKVSFFIQCLYNIDNVIYSKRINTRLNT